MKKIVSYFLGNTLLKGSFVVFVGSLISNFGTYLFHLVMGRMLGPADYGVLESLISISYFLGIPISVLGLIIVKYVSGENKNTNNVASFVVKISKKTTKWGLLSFVIFLLLFPILSRLVKVNSFPFFLALGISSFLSIYLTIFASVFQGIMKFIQLSIFNVLNTWSKLLFSIILLILGFKVGGAIYAGVMAAIITIFFGYFFAIKYLPLNFKQKEEKNIAFPNIRSYATAVFISNLTLTSFYTVDIILARYFLPSALAGQYASLSVLGKIIFFSSSSIVSVMFPMVSAKHANGEDYRKPLWLSFLFVLILSLIISTVYFIFPKQMIGLLFGSSYLSVSGSLGLFAIFISIYSLCSLFMNFFLSISKLKPIYLSIVFPFIQIILIVIFHQSVRQIVWVNIISLLLFLFALISFTKDSFPKSKLMIESLK